MSRDPDDLRRSLFAVSEAILAAAVLVMIGVWSGNWLDDKLKTGPWLSISLSLLGAGLGLWRMVAKAMAIDTGSGGSSRAGKTGALDSRGDRPGDGEGLDWENEED